MTLCDAARRLVVSPALLAAMVCACGVCVASAAAPPPDGSVITRLMHNPDGDVKPAKAAQPATDIVADISPLVVEGIVNTTPAELWKVFSTAEGFKAFGVAQCEMDFKPGGLIKTHYDPKGVIGDDGTVYNRILAYEPERMIAFRIDKPPAKFPFPNAWQQTWSVATLTDLGDGRTALRLTGMGYTADEESQKMRAFFKAGNAWSMKKLQTKFETNAAPMPKGDAHAQDPLAPIEIEAVVNGPREEVFAAYTSSAGWKSFFGTESKIELRPGGPFEIYFSMEPPEGQRGSEGCVVLSYVPGRMFSYTWNAPPKFAEERKERTWVVVTFDDVNAGQTRVRAMHMGFRERAAAHPDRKENYEAVRGYFAKAWPKVFGELKKKWEKAPKDAAATSADAVPGK